MIINIKEIYCGKEQIINDRKRTIYPTSYKKEKLNKEEYFINKFGFADDNQSDKNHHGGLNKAVCVYPQKSYDFFKSKYDFDLPSCAFGENFTILDFGDDKVCLGDIYQCEDVLFEVSQPRQPCWKISSVLGIKNLTSLVVKEHKTGFYLRVLKEGKIKRGSHLKLISREFPKLTIEHINKCAFDAKNNQENIKEILECQKLADAYKISLNKRYVNKEFGVQDWQRDDY